MSAVVRAAILAVSFLIAGCIGPEGTEILGTEYRDPPDAPDFTLKNQFGEDVSLSDFDGKVVVVAFIYTACPDVCLIISSNICLLYTSPSPRDLSTSRMPSSA